MWRVLACVTVAVTALGGALHADAYVVSGRAWPNGVIRYYNAAPDQAWALQRAVAAWNASGARIRFVAASAASADVRIEHFPGVKCTVNAEATVGYGPKPRVWIFNLDDGSPYCNRYVAAAMLVHELGHVLGLGHETRGCAAMNPSGNARGPALCTPSKDWQWRCKLLTADDVAGAVSIYGGAVRRQPGPSDCDLYAGEAAPTGLTVKPTSVPHQFAVSFRRPATVSVPAFLTAEHRNPESFVAASSNAGCPHDPRTFPARLWDAAAGEVEQTALRLPTGTSCIRVWAVDVFGRPSARPATTTLRVVESP